MRESVKRATPASNRVGWPVLTMYIVERFPFLSIWTYHIAYVPLKKKNFIYKWRGTYYSFSYNLALGISKILTLRLALRLFGKSSNNGSAVYIVLAIWDRMNCCTSTTWARVEGRGRVLLPPSWFIGPFYSLCQILTKDLTNKMLMHVKKNYLIGFVFEHSFQKYNVWWHAWTFC